MPTINNAHQHLGLTALPIPNDELPLSVASVASFTPPPPNMPPPPLLIAAVMGMTAYPITSVSHPTNEYNILMGDSGDLPCKSNDLASNHVPFCILHLVWHCAPNDFSSHGHLHMEALIDHGSPVVLIDHELASCLQLCLYTLLQQFPVSGAFFSEPSASSSILLTHWVKVKLCDHNNYYSA